MENKRKLLNKQFSRFQDPSNVRVRNCKKKCKGILVKNKRLRRKKRDGKKKKKRESTILTSRLTVHSTADQ